MRLVGLDDHLHQLVPDDVFITEVNEVDAINAGQHALSFNQSAAFAVGPIELGEMAPGEGREISSSEREQLRAALDSRDRCP